MSKKWAIGGFTWLVTLGWVIDLLATGGNYVSSYCMTPAYIGMPLAYGVLCAAGAASRHYGMASVGYSVASLVLFMGLGALGAFILSNAFFYKLSGYFDQMPVAEFAMSVVQYFPSYILTAQLYILGWFVLDYKLDIERQIVAKAGSHE